MKIDIVGDFYYPEDDLSKVKKFMKKKFADSELIVMNFEAPITETKKKANNKPYNFKVTSRILQLFDNRFILCLANNHIMDYGNKGLEDTLVNLKNNNTKFIGTEGKRKIIIKENILSLFNYCDSGFVKNSSEISIASNSKVIKDIKNSKEKNIILMIHQGWEFTKYPDRNQYKLFKALTEEDSLKYRNIYIIFHHNHTVASFKKKKNIMAIWSAGNFVIAPVCTEKFSPWFKSAIWSFELEKDLLMFKDVDTYNNDSEGIPFSPNFELKRQILKDSHKPIFIYRLKSLLQLISFGYIYINLVNYYRIFKGKNGKQKK